MTAIAFVTCPGTSSEGLGVGSDEPVPFPSVKPPKWSERLLKVKHKVGINGLNGKSAFLRSSSGGKCVLWGTSFVID